MLKDFKDFLVQGNLVALAVAVVIGLAFQDVIKSLIDNIITPLIAAIGGQPDFSALDFTLNSSIFRYGLFLNALIAFLVIAAVVFFFIIRPYNRLKTKLEKSAPDDPPEYAVETGSSSSLPAQLNARAADGWKVVSVGEGADGSLSAVLVKGEAS
ncbi:MAG: large conductance mechanosensitive channel protein MscL [Thermoleophilia bacterium]